MKFLKNLLAIAILAIALPTLAMAGSPRDLSVKSIFEFPLVQPTPANGDFTVYWQGAQRRFVRIDAATVSPINRTAVGTILSGQTSIAITMAGVTSASRCQATQSALATNAVYIRAAVPTTNTVTVTVSADPGVSNQPVAVLCTN